MRQLATPNSEADSELEPYERDQELPDDEEQPSGQEFDEDGHPVDPNAGF